MADAASSSSIFGSNRINSRSSLSRYSLIINSTFFNFLSYPSIRLNLFRMTSSSPRDIFALNIVSVIIDFLQLKSQGKNQTPFETHPKTMCVAISCCLGYYWTCNAEERFSSLVPHYHHVFPTVSLVLRCCKILMGNFSVALAASVLFPDSVRPVLVLFCIMLSCTELFVELLGLYPTIMPRIRRHFSTSRAWRNFYESFAEHGYLLPR